MAFGAIFMRDLVARLKRRPMDMFLAQESQQRDKSFRKCCVAECNTSFLLVLLCTAWFSLVPRWHKE